jgi:hypothetical protein
LRVIGDGPIVLDRSRWKDAMFAKGTVGLRFRRKFAASGLAAVHFTPVYRHSRLIYRCSPDASLVRAANPYSATRGNEPRF